MLYLYKSLNICFNNILREKQLSQAFTLFSKNLHFNRMFFSTSSEDARILLSLHAVSQPFLHPPPYPLPSIFYSLTWPTLFTQPREFHETQSHLTFGPTQTVSNGFSMQTACLDSCFKLSKNLSKKQHLALGCHKPLAKWPQVWHL